MPSKYSSVNVILFFALFASCACLNVRDPCTNYCEYTSTWSSWDCSGCVQNGGTIKRYRALCCYYKTKNECFTHCNKTDADITQSGSCSTICSTTIAKTSTLQTTSRTTMIQMFSTVNQLNASSNISTTPLTGTVSKASVFRNVSTTPLFRNASTAQTDQNQSRARDFKNISMVTMSQKMSITIQDSAENTSITQVLGNVFGVTVPPHISLSQVSGNVSTKQVSGSISTEPISSSTTATINSTNSSDAPGMVSIPPSWTDQTNTTISNTATTDNESVVDNEEENENLDRESDCREECHQVNGTNRCTQYCSETKQYSLCAIVSICLFLLGMVIGALVTAITVHCCCCCGNRNKHGSRHKAVNETCVKTTDPYTLKTEYITKDGKGGHGFSPARAKKLRQISPVSSTASLIYPWSDSDQDSPRVSPRVQSLMPDYGTDDFSVNDFMKPEFTNGRPDVNKRNNRARVSLID